MKNKFLFLAVLILMAARLSAQTITHSFRNLYVRCPALSEHDATRHYVINFAYNDLEDFKVTADVRKPERTRRHPSDHRLLPHRMKVVKGEGQDSKGHVSCPT
jgi:hypothetical protein